MRPTLVFLLVLSSSVSLGCGTRTLDSRTSDASTDALTDVVLDTAPPADTTPLLLTETTACAARDEGCGAGGAAEVLDGFFLDMRKCAPGTVSNVCLFEVTVDFDSSGCATKAYAVAHPAGIDEATADHVLTCMQSLFTRKRYSCLASQRVRPPGHGC